MIFDDWGIIVRPLLVSHPFAWLYAVSFTLIAAFVLLNLVVGYLVDNIQRIRYDREFTSHQGLLHESDRLQEQLERFEKEFTIWQRHQHKHPDKAALAFSAAEDVSPDQQENSDQ